MTIDDYGFVTAWATSEDRRIEGERWRWETATTTTHEWIGNNNNSSSRSLTMCFLVFVFFSKPIRELIRVLSSSYGRSCLTLLGVCLLLVVALSEVDALHCSQISPLVMSCISSSSGDVIHDIVSLASGQQTTTWKANQGRMKRRMRMPGLTRSIVGSIVIPIMPTMLVLQGINALKKEEGKSRDVCGWKVRTKLITRQL